jgi:[acyl-carrier-protein] S-malonyltransferase
MTDESASPHAHGHAHGPAHPGSESRSAAAAREQRTAAVVGWVDGVSVQRSVLDERIRVLRSGRQADRLPTPGSKEDRQFVRWTAQVLLTEELCRVQTRRLDVVGRSSARELSQIEALHLGSINAAAWTECPEMSALFDAVTPPSDASRPAEAAPLTWWRVSHARASSAEEASRADLRSLGWTTLDDLPAPLAGALRAVPLGTRVGPVETRLGWHVAVVTEAVSRPSEQFQPAADNDRFREFARWLDLQRRRLLTVADGFEHPGDPTQPDNTHRH